MSRTTSKQNPIDAYNTIEARHTALNHLFVNVAYIAANIDDEINKLEVSAIKKEFPFFQNSSEFEDLQTNPEYLYFCCKRILKFCNESADVINNLFIKIFRIITADGAINAREVELIEKLIDYLKLPQNLALKAFEVYFSPENITKNKKISSTTLKKQIASLHPDKFYSLNLKDENLKTKILDLANNRLKILNNFYKK